MRLTATFLRRVDSPLLRVTTAAVIVALLSALGPARASNNAWTGNTDSYWTTSALQQNWSRSPFYWQNQFVDSALFQGSGGTVTVTSPIVLRGLSLDVNPYTLASGNGSAVLTLTAGNTGTLADGEVQVGYLSGSGVTGSVNVPIAGSVGLTKTYPGTLLLGGLNTYTGGTNVYGGTLAVTAFGAVLPAGGNVTVAAGPTATSATFNFGNGATIDNSGAAIGTLTLNNGTFRVSGGAGDFFLNKLIAGASGGTVDFTGAGNFWLRFNDFNGTGTGITVNGNSTWVGGGEIHNDSSAPLPIYVANGSTLTNGIVLSSGGLYQMGFRLTGTPGFVNNMVLTNSSNTADLIADSTGYLVVGNLANLGTGSLTLQNTANDIRPGALRYDGGTATLNKPITLGPGGGQIQVTTSGTNLTQAGVIGENTPGSALTVDSNGPGNTPGILTLTATNSYTGPTYLVYNGYLSVASIPNGGVAGPLGASSNSPANLSIGKANNGGGGTLQYTGPTATTDRGFTLSDGNGGNTDAIEVANAATKLTFTGQVTGNGTLTKTGPGILTLTNAANNYTGGSVVTNGYLEVPILAALGSGGIALQIGGRLAYSGPTAGTSKAISLGDFAGVDVETPGTNLTLSGTISETAAGSRFYVYGPTSGGGAAVTLAGTNTYTGLTAISTNAIVSVATLPAGGTAGPLGSSSNLPSNLVLGLPGAANGTLQYTGGTTSTDRGFTLNLGTDSIEVTTAATNLTVTGQIIGTGGLTKIGPGTLTLTNAANSYTGGTYVTAGTLTVGASGAVIPSGSNVTVNNAGSVFNVGFTSGNNAAAPIGALTLNGGTYRMAPGSPSYYLNQLTTGATGGMLDFTGAAGGALVFAGNAASISVNGNSSWSTTTYSPFIGTAASAGTVPITIAPGVTLTNAISLAPTGGFRITGGGTLYQTGPGLCSGYFTVNQARLRADAMSPLQFADLTLDAGTLQFTGPSDTRNNGGNNGLALTLAVAGGTVEVTNPGTTLTVAGLIAGTGQLTKTGPGTLLLTNAGNTYSGGTNVSTGVLAVNSDAALAGGPVTVGPAGTLSYTSTNTTSRSFMLNSGSLSAAAGATVTLNGATVAGGFLRGAGTFLLAGGTTLTGVTSAPSTTLNQTGPAMFTNFTNGSSLTIGIPSGPGKPPAMFDLFTNQGSGAITVMASSQVSASDFQTYGQLTLSPGTPSVPTQLTNNGASNLYFNGGSRTFISVPANAGLFDAGIDLHGNNAVVAGGLFVNNGYVVDSVGAGTKTVIADFGSLVKGAGFYQNSVQTVNGGKFQSGNSPGSSSFGSFTFGPGGVNNYVFAIDDATGAAGPSPDANGQVSGWGLVKAIQRPVGSITTPGDFAWTADPGHKLTFALQTLVNPTTVGTDVAGPMADFDLTRPYSWLAGQWTGAYSGPTDPAALNAATVFDTSGFQNPIAGAFGWSLDTADRTLSLTYTPGVVPEPGTLALLGAAAFAFAAREVNRRRRAR
jgi:fibronectin-binding autotransporter adhesin